MIWITSFGICALIVITVSFIWRMASHRQALPCPVWLGWMVELDNPFTRTNRASEIIRNLELDPGMAVLDAGCGPGRLTIPLAQYVTSGRVVAMDIQEGMLTRVKEKAVANNLGNIEYLDAGLGTGQLPVGCFDRAVMVTVLGEIPDQSSAMQEVYNALKPGGMLSVTELVFDPHFQSRSSVTRQALSVGFIEHAFRGSRLAYTIQFIKSGKQ